MAVLLFGFSLIFAKAAGYKSKRPLHGIKDIEPGGFFQQKSEAITKAACFRQTAF